MKQCSKNIMHLIVLSPIHKMILVSILIPLSIVKWNFTRKIKYTRKSIYFSIQFPNPTSKSTLQSLSNIIHPLQSILFPPFFNFLLFFSFISISIRRFYKLTESRPVDRNDSITRRNNTRSQMEREGRGRGRGERTQLIGWISYYANTSPLVPCRRWLCYARGNSIFAPVERAISLEVMGKRVGVGVGRGWGEEEGVERELVRA